MGRVEGPAPAACLSLQILRLHLPDPPADSEEEEEEAEAAAKGNFLPGCRRLSRRPGPESAWASRARRRCAGAPRAPRSRRRRNRRGERSAERTRGRAARRCCGAGAGAAGADWGDAARRPRRCRAAPFPGAEGQPGDAPATPREAGPSAGAHREGKRPAFAFVPGAGPGCQRCRPAVSPRRAGTRVSFSQWDAHPRELSP